MHNFIPKQTVYLNTSCTSWHIKDIGQRSMMKMKL